MSETRFKPVRAGIINLWDYYDEEFAFADGRLALRGHNGSGKTKALEVLFPFVLDARRLDPFSGENRTMKANLLYRGQDSEHGYVWMEFGRPGETVTLVIGLSVHKNMDRPRPSFYVTGKRMGIDFGLLSADSRPLTTKQLTAILGRDANYGDKRGAYTDAVDARLFGLGRERYTQLLDLLIALRRPLLAKDLDPAKVSETLTAGLSPVDDDLVTQAARDFENLAAVQKQYDDLYVEVGVLLDGEVPDVPGVAAVVPQHCLLGGRGEQPVPGHANTLSDTADISGEVKRRFLPALKAGVPTPRFS